MRLNPLQGMETQLQRLCRKAGLQGNLHVMLHGVSMSGKSLVGFSVSP